MLKAIQPSLLHVANKEPALLDLDQFLLCKLLLVSSGQAEENPFLTDSFTQIYIIFAIGFQLSKIANACGA